MAPLTGLAGRLARLGRGGVEETLVEGLVALVLQAFGVERRRNRGLRVVPLALIVQSVDVLDVVAPLVVQSAAKVPLPRSEYELGHDNLEVLADRLRQEAGDVPVHVQRLGGFRDARGSRRHGVELEIVGAEGVVAGPLLGAGQRGREQTAVVVRPSEQERVPLARGLELQPREELAASKRRAQAVHESRGGGEPVLPRRDGDRLHVRVDDRRPELLHLREEQGEHLLHAQLHEVPQRGLAKGGERGEEPSPELPEERIRVRVPSLRGVNQPVIDERPERPERGGSLVTAPHAAIAVILTRTHRVLLVPE